MNTKRNIYLEKRSLSEAREMMMARFAHVAELQTEVLAAVEAVGRVLAEPVTARLSSPNFHSAAMDGIAVKAETTFGTNEQRPRTLVIGESAFWVNTGHVMPEDTDAVIMIENVQEIGEGQVQIEAPAFPWQYVRKMGEDIVATELLFPRNHRITPYCVGALLSGGVFEVRVKEQPHVLIIPTGGELVNWRDTTPESFKPGQVIETNSHVLGKLVEACGGRYTRQDTVMDNLEAITEKVREAVSGDFHMVLTIGGSSAGSEDFAKPVISGLGEVLVHGVTMMPGKPVLIGSIEEKPVFGIPGYPVSAIIAFEQFVQPLICRMLGQPEPRREAVAAYPTRKIASKLGVEEFLRVKLGQVGDRVVATPLPRGAGSITSITEADGIIRIPRHHEGLKPEAAVSAELLRSRAALENTIVAVGSHDNTLDVLADEIRRGGQGLTFSSSHVGSMGGLMAVKRGNCHLAGAHLLDIDDGTYNVSYIRTFLPDIPVRQVHLVMREQGLIVPRGNPAGIKSIEDLTREKIRLINRQGGSGTRILLDYRLNQMGMDPGQINGYENEEFTHMSVAVAVQSGIADVGLGIYAAARALDLDFIPVVTEQYDLIIPEIHFETANMQILLNTIRSDRFKQRVNALGGYDTGRTGEMM